MPQNRRSDTPEESTDQWMLRECLDLVRYSPIGIFQSTPSGRIISANPALADMFGYASPQEMIGSINDLDRQLYANPVDRQRFRRLLEARDKVVNFESRQRRRDGSLFWASFSAHVVRDRSGQVRHYQGFISDISAVKAAAEQTAEAERRYRAIFENAPVAIFQATPAGRFIQVNPTYAQIAGFASPAQMVAEITDIATQMYVHPPVRDQYKSLLAEQGYVHNFEALLKRRDGSTFWASMNTRCIRDERDRILSYDGFLVDVTEQKALEAQLQQAQKMEAVGTLAGGIAHDFNNILQAIHGFSQLLLARRRHEDPDYHGLVQINRSCQRAAQLVRQLLAFSRKMEGERRATDLNLEVMETEKVLQRTLPKMIHIKLSLQPDLWPIHAYPTQIEQILLNLGSNAADAMQNGGTLRIETGNIVLDEAYCREHLEARPGRHVLLSVSDTGCGMDEETLRKIYDPFFTTKEVGKGTGLGLASVYGIVKSHDGHIRCTSSLNQGTCFRIYMPAIECQPIQAEASDAQGRTEGGTETILVVDDDHAVRELTTDLLESLGYAVVSVVSGEEALRVFQHQRAGIDLVILDLGMPGMGGHKCLKELLKLDARTKVLVASGYSAQGSIEDILAAGAAGFIGKPYHLSDLAATIRNILAG
jgi:PAS domain S-box-containing protein